MTDRHQGGNIAIKNQEDLALTDRGVFKIISSQNDCQSSGVR